VPEADRMPTKELFPKQHFIKEISNINVNTQLPREPSGNNDLVAPLTSDDVP
jgi:hypothetical protein